MERAYYAANISDFLSTKSEEILGILTAKNEFPLEIDARQAWQQEIRILQNVLPAYSGKIYFEYSIPRMGKRIDVLLIVANAVFILEFKVGESEHTSYAIDQVWDYALDLKNFHETSHHVFIVPILIATKSKPKALVFAETIHNDQILRPVLCNIDAMQIAIEQALNYSDNEQIDIESWENGRYLPTPTIIEAASVLYNGHSVKEISRSDAQAINLSTTTDAISEIIEKSMANKVKSICFVTGVPGAGKTLVGLNIANKYRDPSIELHSVFLSGNQPLVSVLIEALTRDKYEKEKQTNAKTKKETIKKDVKSFIQIIHHFRDECLRDPRPPIEHVTLFDEAQRAWNVNMTSNFMARKKGKPDFNISEPDYLISCMDRHGDWAVIVCLVGGGQEINTGEAGIGEWISALDKTYPDWHVYISSKLKMLNIQLAAN